MVPQESKPTDGWGEWSKHVLAELVRLNGCYEDLNKTMQKVQIEIATLKVKSGVWGFLAGAVPAVVVLIYWAAGR